METAIADPAGGPIDDFVMAKLRNAVLSMTDSGRVLESVEALLPGLERAPAMAVAAEVSAKLRAVLLPLVK